MSKAQEYMQVRDVYDKIASDFTPLDISNAE
jgi:hypothetical protein